MKLNIWIGVVFGSLSVALVLLIRLIRRSWLSLRYIRPPSSSIETLIILGSGGHTSEMFKLVSSLDVRRFSPRIYVIAEEDRNSLERLRAQDPSGTLLRVPRSRSVAQSYFSSVFTTLHALRTSLRILLKVRPELLLANGPGTCFPLCLLGWAYRKAGILSPRTKIVFVESVCRVQSLSLSARLCMPFVDHVLVQWPELANKFPGTKYIDRFI